MSRFVANHPSLIYLEKSTIVLLLFRPPEQYSVTPYLRIRIMLLSLSMATLIKWMLLSCLNKVWCRLWTVLLTVVILLIILFLVTQIYICVLFPVYLKLWGAIKKFSAWPSSVQNKIKIVFASYSSKA